jgi:hypothetical protein
MSDTNPRPSYYSQLRIDPNNDLKVWVLGAPLYYTEDGGRTFRQDRWQRIHSDFHAFWIDPANSDHIYAGSDGGLTITNDGGRTWDFYNNFPIGQFYEIAYDMQKPYHVCGGLQDNNTWCGPSATLQTRGISNDEWIAVSGGDGFYARIDPKEANIVYAESQDGNLSRRDLNTGETKSIRPLEENDKPPRYRFQWNSPLLISPHDNKTIYYGGNYLFKSTDRGDTWDRLGNKDLTTGADRATLPIFGKPVDKDTLSRNDGVVSWPCITAIAESPVKAGILWAGTDDGNVQLSRDGGKTWTNLAGRMPGAPKGGYVSRIEASWRDEGTAYVAFDNHRGADYAVYIYMSRNYGDSWTKITGGIPPEAGTVHVVREDPADPNLLFAGTEFGLFVSFSRGSGWERMTNGLPPAPVFDLQIHPRERDLIVATHGRSIYILDNIRPLEQLTDSVLSTDLKMFDGPAGVPWRLANYKSFTGAREFLAPNPPSGVILDYYAKAAGPVTITVKDAFGNTVRTLTGRAEAGAVNRTSWDLRYDAPVRPPVTAGAPGAVGGRGGRGGRGGGAPPSAAAAAPDAPGETLAEPPGEGAAAGRGGGGGGGFGGFGLGGRGPLVDPGEYTVTIAQGGRSDGKTVTVEEDPRLTISAEDRTKRRQAITRLVTMARDAEQNRRRIVAMNTALNGLAESWKRPGAPQVPDSVRKAVEEFLSRVKTVLPSFDVERGNAPAQLGAAGAPLVYTLPTVNSKIGRLMSSIDGYTGAPTPRQMTDIDNCSAQLQQAVAEVNRLNDDLPKLNKTMADAGVPYVTLDTTNVPPPAGRGGGY